MTIKELMKLKIPSSDNAVLYMWTTSPKLEESFNVLKAWGFLYKSCAIWDKEIIGMGYWFRGQHEILIVGVKGKFSPPPQKLRVSSVIREKRTKHSKKPLKVMNLIASWYPDCSRIELFARTQTPGWDVWGNEV